MPPARVEEVAIPGYLLRALHLGQVEVDALASSRLGASRVEKSERGTQNGCGHGTAVHGHFGFVEMEAALAVHEEGQLAGRDLVRAIACGVGEGELSVHRGEAVMGGAHGVDQAMARGVLVVVEVTLRALALGPRIERIDEHAGDGAWPGDLDAGTLEVVRHGR